MNRGNAIHWRLRQPRYRLLGSLCERCGHPVFPSRPLCPDCAKGLEDELIVTGWDSTAVILLPLVSPNYAD